MLKIALPLVLALSLTACSQSSDSPGKPAGPSIPGLPNVPGAPPSKPLKELSPTQKMMMNEVGSSFSDASSVIALEHISLESATLFEDAVAVLYDADRVRRMKELVQANCEMRSNLPPDGEIQQGTFNSSIGGASCPIDSQYVVTNTITGNQSAATVSQASRTKYAVKSSDYSAMNDVNAFEMASNLVVNLVGENLNMQLAAKFVANSQVHGTVGLGLALGATGQKEGGPTNIQLELSMDFRDFSAKGKVIAIKGSDPLYFINGQPATEREFTEVFGPNMSSGSRLK